MGNAKIAAEEDLAIQDTLSMTTEERLDLLSCLLAEKILSDQLNNQTCSLEIEGQAI